MEADVVAGRIATRQRGLLTVEQALAAGITPREIGWRTRTGRWVRLHTGVVAIAGSPETWERRVQAAVLAGGPGTVASHLSAAVLHRFPDAVADQIEITVPAGRQPRPRNVRVHRPKLMPEHDVRVVEGIPVTSFARTLVDCSGRMSLGQIARVLDAGLVRGDVTLWSVERSLSALKQAPGRHPSKLWPLLDERGSETAAAESPPEMRVARLLVAAGLPVPQQQHWVVVGRDRFRLDLAYPDQKVAIEYDGWDAHRSRRSFDSDRRRDRVLQLDGWVVLRVTSQTPDAELVQTVRAFVRGATQSA